ncbi:MAG: arginine--tRNA ligase [Planctomycetes bacterium]|nr:arginine--tRNA ligase [Planctomycetota bacterium]
MNLLTHLQRLFHGAVEGIVADPARYAAMVKPAQDARFGDYQANCAMSLAKQLRQKPRDVAERLAASLDLSGMLEKPEVAGPGFINLRLRTDWLAAQLQRMAAADRLAIEPVQPPRTYVIDYSSPNVAKPMHVGHLRSTIIGDALARLLRFLGHKVIADNHLGDWGTQFGMLLYGYKHHRDEEALRSDPVREMVRLYLLVRREIDPAEKVEEEPGNAKDYSEADLTRSREALAAVRSETAKLHAGDEENLALWRQFMPWCYAEIEAIYRRLDVHFDHTFGESFYQPMLVGLVDDLLARGIARPSEGAIAVFVEGEETPTLVRYRNGAYTYTTTDLATIRYRMEQWHPDASLYVVGTPQEMHFRRLFGIARRWGYDTIELEHIKFGSVLERLPNGKTEMFRTRAGRVVELGALLDEAVVRAAQQYEQTRADRLERGEEVPQLSQQEEQQIAEVVGLGAVKYADLCQNRTSDYVFDWDKMLAMDGNTATYMQYAYVRNRGIFRRGNVDPAALRSDPPRPILDTPHERALAVQLLRFHEALDAAVADYKPNLITAYLWDLSKAYSGFFDNCPVLKAPTPELRQSRLLLCDLTARVIQRGLDLLGIRTVERM